VIRLVIFFTKVFLFHEAKEITLYDTYLCVRITVTNLLGISDESKRMREGMVFGREMHTGGERGKAWCG
jgi:hypothetical protein